MAYNNIKQEIKLDKDAYKIGIITDVHGNDVALKEALKELSDCDFYISLGDLIGIGPNSNEVLDIVREVKKTKDFYTILGNHERYLMFGFNNPLSCLSDSQQKFTENSITLENKKFICDFPLEYEINWKGTKIALLHYERKIYDDVRFKLIKHYPNYDDLDLLFDLHDAKIILYGHEHTGSIIGDISKRLFINPGSTGCPCPKKNTFRCGKLILSERIEFQKIEKEYDASSVVKSMIDKKMPNKELVIVDFYKEKLK